MKITSLELSKQLKEAGYPQESYFYWNEYTVNHNKGWKLQHWTPEHMDNYRKNYEGKAKGGLIAKTIIASPTADEVLEQLPDCIVTPTGGRFAIRIVLHLAGVDRQYEVHTDGF